MTLTTTTYGKRGVPMNRIVFGESVQGASHIRVDKECQDSCKKIDFAENIAIISVADGHGSNSCPYSKTGSVIAVNVFCKVMTDFCSHYENNMNSLMTYLNREGDTKVAQVIDAEWKKRVYKQHIKNKREVVLDGQRKMNKEAIYKQYGSTLLGVMITPTYLFAFQLGDGDIMYVDDEGVKQVIEGDKILGTETHSLSKKNAWKCAITVVSKRDVEKKLPYLYMLSSDGMANSFTSQDEFYKTCQDYYDLIKEHGCKTIAINMKEWLNETSTMGCGDDITVMFGYYAESLYS